MFSRKHLQHESRRVSHICMQKRSSLLNGWPFNGTNWRAGTFYVIVYRRERNTSIVPFALLFIHYMITRCPALSALARIPICLIIQSPTQIQIHSKLLIKHIYKPRRCTTTEGLTISIPLRLKIQFRPLHSCKPGKKLKEQQYSSIDCSTTYLQQAPGKCFANKKKNRKHYGEKGDGKNAIAHLIAQIECEICRAWAKRSSGLAILRTLSFVRTLFPSVTARS